MDEFTPNEVLRIRRNRLKISQRLAAGILKLNIGTVVDLEGGKLRIDQDQLSDFLQAYDEWSKSGAKEAVPA